ncbi:two-component signal transduction [Rhodopirellula islandica]|uniref:histidine kinase n=1 Tax=Rhodopirellula islandica TaxID=595434 RepID=A0A0J1B4Z7_RHOIS|nr:ATP-binding protein [Rhodopirellula islandica]KLU01693.1 two-component signal transduction [Rhodopirellula islandica]
MASLFVIRGRDQGKHFQLASTVTRLGRESSNNVQLLDNEASRSHAEIRGDGTGRRYELVDLGSSNGTLVNNRKITRHVLTSGDRIEIGSTLLIFTGTGNVSALDAAHGVDIVRQVRGGDASNIVSSLSREGVVSPYSPEGASSGAVPTPKPTSAPTTLPPPIPPPVETGADPARSAGKNPSVVTPERTGQFHGPPVIGRLDADRSLEVMYLTAIAVGRTDDLDEVLDRVLKLVFDWVEADRGCIMLRDPETKRLTPAARCDRDSASDGPQPKSTSKSHDRIQISHTILDYVLQHKQGVRTNDALDDERFDSAASIVQGGVREALCVPLQGRYEIVGMLYVDTYTTPGELVRKGGATRFHDEHLRLITAVGHQAALAIEDTFYYSALLQGERLAAMGQTIATLSHHIKNILQGVRGGSYLIESGLQKDDTEAIRRGWSIVDRNQERISNLVLDMLTFSKERDPVLREGNLNEVVHDVVELMQSRAGQGEIELVSETEDTLPIATFDGEAIHRAVLNLVTNAIDAATKRVLVKTFYDAAEGWIVDVEDDGEGVPKEDREQIFSLFESKKGARGTGLGLPVSAKILREHGGSLTVDDSPSGGARFRMILPATGTDINELSRSETQA